MKILHASHGQGKYHNAAAVVVIILIVLAGLHFFVAGGANYRAAAYVSYSSASSNTSQAAEKLSGQDNFSALTPLGIRAAANFHPVSFEGIASIGGSTGSPGAQAVYDEQIGITFTQNFSSLAYNVTAVEQQDADGFGPAYLLQGVSNSNYWYQVGLAWNWPLLSGGYLPGFNLLYEVFDPSQNSIFPSGGGGGLGSFSGQVNSGDKVLLSLYFSTNGNVTMYARDWNTGASEQESYFAEGASYFEGLASSPASNGFFTGLMTEQYHSSPYFGSEQEAIYSNATSALSSAWQWIDEYNVNTLESEFSASTFTSFSSNPTQLRGFSSNGAAEAASAYDFITGSANSIEMTLSYSLLGGGAGYSAPVISYTSDGVQQTATMTTTPKVYPIDSGTSWSVTNLLGGSTSIERWITNQTTSATATAPQTIAFVYNHQYLVTFAVNPKSGGSTIPSTGSTWYNAGSSVAMSATPNPPYFLSAWAASSQSISITNPSASSASAIIGGSGTITANFGTGSISLEPASGAVTQGSSVHITGTVRDGGQSATLSVSGLPSGATTEWSSNPVTSSPSGVEDTLTIRTAYSTPAGSYTLTVAITIAGGSTSTQLNLTIIRAIPLSLSYSVQGAGSNYSAPMISYVYNGTSSQSALSATMPTTIYADQNTGWSVSSSLPGSTTTDERWQTNQSSGGTASSNATINFVYYHQYLVTFSYTVEGGGSGYAPPTVTYAQFGSNLSTTAGQKVWADASSEYSYTNPLGGSARGERWEAGNLSSGQVSLATTISPTYYNQYTVGVRYSIENGAGQLSPDPIFTFESLGVAQSQNLGTTSTTYWVDAGSNYDASTILGVNPKERLLLITNSTTTIEEGAVSSKLSLDFVYEHQYYLSTQPNVPAGGMVSPQSGWINAEDNISISSSAGPGWKFEYWSGSGAGSYSGDLSVAAVKLDAPVSETATFYPGLTIGAVGPGSVSYSLGTNSGSAGAKPETVYLPYGESVSLRADPSSIFYKFDYFTGGNETHSSTIVLDSPKIVEAHFSYNYASIGGLVIALAGGMVMLVALVRGRRRQKVTA
ncbi:MAG: InlB B-repeat-containing protein [Nitrososphaerales archaeon]